MHKLKYVCLVPFCVTLCAMQPASTDINATDNYGYSKLMRAALYGKKEDAGNYIKNGANLNMKNIHGETALILSTYHEKSGIAEILIQAGALVNEQDKNGKTALHRAATRDLNLVKTLLAAKADPTLHDKEKNTPRMVAELRTCCHQRDLQIYHENVDDKIPKYYSEIITVLEKAEQDYKSK